MDEAIKAAAEAAVEAYIAEQAQERARRSKQKADEAAIMTVADVVAKVLVVYESRSERAGFTAQQHAQAKEMIVERLTGVG